MGDDEEARQDDTADGLALLSEQMEELKALQAKQNELTQSQVELAVRTNELLKELLSQSGQKIAQALAPLLTQPQARGAPAGQPAEPAPAPGKRRASLSETAEKLKKDAEAGKETGQ